MKKTLFKKYLRMTMLTIVASFCILGVVMVAFTGNDWREDQQSSMGRIARSVTEIVADGMIESDGSLALDTDKLEVVLPSLSKNNNCDLLLTDTAGNILMMSRGTEAGFTRKKLPKEVMDLVLAGNYNPKSMLGGIYSVPYFVVGIPV